MTNSDAALQFIAHPDGRIAYREAGSGDTVVIVHGTPSSSLEYAELIYHLKQSYRFVAIDHLGFGESDKPKDADYSIEAHTSRLRWLLLQLEIKSFHLLVHDFGGVIGIPIAFEENFSIRSLTILNSWAWPLIETEPKLKQQIWLLRSRIMKWAYLYLNFSPRILLKLAWGKHRPLTKQKHQAYLAAFRSPSERYGLLGFKDALVNFDLPCWHRKGLEKLGVVPVFLAWGMSDSLIGPQNLERWIGIFPQAKVSRFEQVGHFVADEGECLLAPELFAFLGQVSSDIESAGRMQRADVVGEGNSNIE